VGVAEEGESDAGEMSSHAVEKIDPPLLLVNLENANPGEAALFYRLARISGHTG
jgi:hypothetical protein